MLMQALEKARAEAKKKVVVVVVVVRQMDSFVP